MGFMQIKKAEKKFPGLHMMTDFPIALLIIFRLPTSL